MTTTHLGLPLIDAAQAQKHVPHNEALFLLDALTQLSVSASMHIYDTWFTDVCACLSESELRQMDESIDKLIHAALLLREQDKPQAK